MNIFKHILIYVLDLTSVDMRCDTISSTHLLENFIIKIHFLSFFHPTFLEEFMFTKYGPELVLMTHL